MKRRSLCVVCLVLYLLLSCTVFSLKIEIEMLTQVEVLKVKGDGMWGQSVSLPQTVLFEDARGIHLYEVIEDSGWESGLRVREIPQDSYELDNENGTVRLPGGSDYCFVTTASRQPIEGELVEIVETGKGQPVSDQLLFVYPEGLPEGLEMPADMKILEQSTQAILVQTENKDMAFFEHKQMERYQSMAGKDWRVFSMNTVEEFCKQTPLVAVITGILLSIFLLWLYSFFVCSRTEHSGKMFLFAGAISLFSIFSMYIILTFIDLPAAMLPEKSILDIPYYFSTFSRIDQAMNTLAFHTILDAMRESMALCGIILVGSLIITVLLLCAEVFFCGRKNTNNQTGGPGA